MAELELLKEEKFQVEPLESQLRAMHTDMENDLADLQDNDIDVDDRTNSNDQQEVDVPPAVENYEEELISGRRVALYPKSETLGYLGHVHHGKIWLKICVHGPDHDPNTVDDNVFEQENRNTFVVTSRPSCDNKSVHGGQIYCPTDILSNFRLAKKEIRDAITTLPSQLSHILSPSSISKLIDSEIIKNNLQANFQDIEAVVESIIMNEKMQDNHSARIELCFAQVFHHNDSFDVKMYWPECDMRPDINSDKRELSHCFMPVCQSEKYLQVKKFFENNLKPITQLLSMEMAEIINLSAATKTRLVFCAEAMTRYTSNSFFQGIIHSELRTYIHQNGCFRVPDRFLMRVNRREIILLNNQLGIDPKRFQIGFDNNNPNKEVLRHVATKRAVIELKGIVDYPMISVLHCQNLKQILQRESYLLRDGTTVVGFFDEPLYDEIAYAEHGKFLEIIKKCASVVVDSYRENRTLIIKTKLKSLRKRSRRNHGEITEAPICVSQIKLYPNLFYLTSEKSKIPNKWQKFISQEDARVCKEEGKLYIF